MTRPLDSGDILDLLSALVEKSLITVDDQTGRYTMLETVRQYSRERLMDDETAPVVRERHLQAMFDLTADFSTYGSVENATLACENIRQELENLRAAIEFGLGSGQHRRVALLLSKIHTYWFVVGSFEEPIGLFREALAPFSDDDMDEVLAEAVLDLAYCELTQGRTTEGRQTLERAATLWTRIGDPRFIAQTYRQLGTASLIESDPDEAESYYLRALEATNGTDEGGRISGGLGYVAIQRQDWPEAKRLLEQSIASLEGVPRVSAAMNLILVYVALGELDSARREILWLLAAFTGMQALFGLLLVFEAVVVYAAATSDFSRAACFLGQADAIRRGSGQGLERSSYVNQASASAKEVLGEEEFNRQFELGAALDPASAAKLAQEFVAAGE